MSWLVRLYPPSWRRRYGEELEGLVRDMPGRAGTALDLLVGAAIAYRDVVRANRILSATGAYLHGLCVAVLVQAIAFVSLVMVAQGRSDPTDLRLGPFDVATFTPVPFFQGPLLDEPVILLHPAATAWLAETLLLAALALMLAAVLTAPRLLRSLR